MYNAHSSHSSLLSVLFIEVHPYVHPINFSRKYFCIPVLVLIFLCMQVQYSIYIRCLRIREQFCNTDHIGDNWTSGLTWGTLQYLENPNVVKFRKSMNEHGDRVSNPSKVNQPIWCVSCLCDSVGVDLEVGVEKLAVLGRVIVTATLDMEAPFPHITRLSLSFTEKPQVWFSVRILKVRGRRWIPQTTTR